MAGTSPAMTKKRILRTRRNLHLPTHLRTLNKMSIKPASYGERFVKRRGLFCMTVASRCRLQVASAGWDNDRSAVHQLDKNRSGGRAGGGHAGFGAGLVDLGFIRGGPRRRRRRAVDAARRCVAAG